MPDDGQRRVLIDVSERIATITLNRPEARNALSSEVLRLLRSRCAKAEANADVDVVILTGTDPGVLRRARPEGTRLVGRQSRRGQRGRRRPEQHGVRGPFPKLSKPLIGAVNGWRSPAVSSWRSNCDFLVAVEHAKFGDTHSRVGVMPGWGLTVLLPQAIGVRRAREMSFTGNFMLADEALRSASSTTSCRTTN